MVSPTLHGSFHHSSNTLVRSHYHQLQFIIVNFSAFLLSREGRAQFPKTHFITNKNINPFHGITSLQRNKCWARGTLGPTTVNTALQYQSEGAHPDLDAARRYHQAAPRTISAAEVERYVRVVYNNNLVKK